jgi:hypothetical protein
MFVDIADLASSDRDLGMFPNAKQFLQTIRPVTSTKQDWHIALPQFPHTPAASAWGWL